MARIGVLALQGDFDAHIGALRRSGHEGFGVRRSAELQRAEGLVIPGGESTTLIKLGEPGGLLEAVKTFAAGGRPVFGTCAGAILLAAEVSSPAQASLGLIDIAIERNAFGRQIDSFETGEGRILEPLGPAGDDGAPLELVFIRAPRIGRMGQGVRTLVLQGEEPVLVRQGGILAATFHPEMSRDGRIHAYFGGMVAAATAAA